MIQQLYCPPIVNQVSTMATRRQGVQIQKQQTATIVLTHGTVFVQKALLPNTIRTPINKEHRQTQKQLSKQKQQERTVYNAHNEEDRRS